jgi:ribosomal protein S18 acetylase RimI-like enzyme
LVQVRFWQESDLPYLQHMAAVTAWQITPPDDKPHTTYQTVAGNAVRNLHAVLQSPHGACVVAEEGGRPVGYLLIGLQTNDKTGQPHGYLADIYVEPQYRRSGLAKQLHDIGEGYLRQIGITRATNWTHAHNPLGQKASEHFGLKLWGMMMSKDLRKARASQAAMMAAPYPR